MPHITSKQFSVENLEIATIVVSFVEPIGTGSILRNQKRMEFKE